MRKKTLRRLRPVTRKVAKLMTELQSIQRRLKNLLPELEELESAQAQLRASEAAAIREAATS